MSNGLRAIRRRVEKQMPRVTPEWMASVEARITSTQNSLVELLRAHNALVTEVERLKGGQETTTPSGIIVPRGV